MRRVFTSFITVGLAAGAVIYGMASFMDMETSAGNSITTRAGPDLQLSDIDEDYGFDPLGDSVLESWVRLNVEPGDDLACASISAKNAGPATGNTMAIQFANDILDPPGPESDTADGTVSGLQMAAYVELSSLTWDGAPSLLSSVDPTSDGVPGKSLADVELHGVFSGLPGLLSPPGGAQALNLCFEFRSDVGNDFRGKTRLTDVEFVLSE